MAAIEIVLIFVLGAALGGGILMLLLKKNAKLQAESQQQNMLAAQLNQEKMEAQLAQRFELLAAKVFEDRTQRLHELQTQNLSVVLNPFKERLKEFEKKVEDSYSAERAERGSLRGELSKLMDLNLKMTGEAENLSRALRGDNRTQGAWGEMVLENILERSGLRRGQEYIVQASDMSLRNENGDSIRPDIIINLPEGKHLILDSKVSLNAYEQYVNSELPEEQERFAKTHADSIRRHVESLAQKKYHTADKLISPDFVILFMPIEPAFALAMKKRPELQQEAWDKHIALVSPTTLLVTLKMVAAIWKTERQERNALEIAEKGGQLYDKFVNLVSDLEGVGRKLQEAQTGYDAAMAKLKDGKGNLLRQVDMLRELGVKTSKRLQIEKNADL